MNRLKTPWADKLHTKDYPRPQMQRESYFNLDGEWDYKIFDNDLSFYPQDGMSFDGKILVPFSPECFLSKVNKTLLPHQIIVYHTTFEQHEINKIALLHFGAVDYQCKVYLNGQLAGSHIGGYTSFTIDITSLLKPCNDLYVVVQDPSDSQPISRGKQCLKDGGIWYTPTSGIWQSVWLEYVDNTYITSLKITPDIDNSLVKIYIKTNTGTKKCILTLNGNTYFSESGEFSVYIDNAQLWSPESPYLYYFTVSCENDKVSSYFAMRKFSLGKRPDGKNCFMLNNKPYFMTGLLDQGYWSDGLYTPPHDEAMIFDIELAKKCGFNTLRKHIKIEPMRWYYHCDRLGMIVWQDFINGGGKYNPLAILLFPNIGINIKDNHYGFYSRKDKKCRELYYKEMDEIVNQLYNCPCIALWTPFNEGWGQFDSLKTCEYLKKLDNTRLIDHASGWSDQGGELKSIHKYFVPFKMPQKENRPVILSEFGGYSKKTHDHVYCDKIFGYAVFKSDTALNDAICKLWTDELMPAKEQGLCACIYTQLSDVQSEVNGIVTYDRQYIKADCEKLKTLNEKLCKLI